MEITNLQLRGFEVLSDKPRLLWANVDRGDGCWNWTGSVNKSGYGSVRVGPTSVLAHRAAYFLVVGPLSDKCVCHTCDNPACCNPDHLFLADHAGNMADLKAKGRRKGVNCGSRNGRAKLSNQAAEEIREKRAGGAILKDIASAYGVGISTISRACRGENWK